MSRPEGELKVSFGYQCNNNNNEVGNDVMVSGCEVSSSSSSPSSSGLHRTSSFSCLSGAAISANATLANTNICNGLIGEEILPSLDSPTSFRKVFSSPSLNKLDALLSSLSCNSSEESSSSYLASNHSRGEGFLNSAEVQIAGGAAGEDRVQAFCSEENGWLFCSIYDGFNGRDAADFLAGTLYDTFMNHFDVAKNKVLESLERALGQAETDFLYMVEQEMENRPDLVSIGSCVLIVLIYGEDLYTLNLGDSRAVLATEVNGSGRLRAVQLSESHTVDDQDERNRVMCEHPDDPMAVFGGKVKGKLKVTRAFGVGYLKKRNLNEALMGILRVQNLISPPYVSIQPSLNVHKISKSDHFVIVGSDGLFDFLSNEEAVELASSYILANPFGDPAKFLVERLVIKAASRAGFSMQELRNIPAGRRRKYHDDVTVMVIILGSNQRTTKASTCI